MDGKEAGRAAKPARDLDPPHSRNIGRRIHRHLNGRAGVGCSVSGRPEDDSVIATLPRDDIEIDHVARMRLSSSGRGHTVAMADCDNLHDTYHGHIRIGHQRNCAETGGGVLNPIKAQLQSRNRSIDRVNGRAASRYRPVPGAVRYAGKIDNGTQPIGQSKCHAGAGKNSSYGAEVMACGAVKDETDPNVPATQANPYTAIPPPTT